MASNTPDFIRTIQEESAAIGETVTELQELVRTVEEYQQRVEMMSEAEQESFYQSISEIREAVSNATTPEDLFAVEDDIEEAVRAPLQQAAQESLGAFLELVDPQLSPQERRSAFAGLETKDPASLETLTAAYEELNQNVKGLPATPIQVLAGVIEATPAILEEPRRLRPTVAGLKVRYESLSTLEAIFERDPDCLPALEFTEEVRFYEENRNNDELNLPQDQMDNILAGGEEFSQSTGRVSGSNQLDTISIDTIEAGISDILVAVDTFVEDEIQVTGAVQSEFVSWYKSGNIESLSNKVEEIKGDVTELESRYSKLAAWMADFSDDDKFKSLGLAVPRSEPQSTEADQVGTQFHSQIKEVRQAYDVFESQNYVTISYLGTQLDQVEKQVNDFIENLYKQLQGQREFIDELDPQDENRDYPDINLTSVPLQQSQVREAPIEALKDYQTLRDWITSNMEGSLAAGDQAEMIEIWRTLTEGNTVPLTEANRDTVMALAERFTLSVTLTEQD